MQLKKINYLMILLLLVSIPLFAQGPPPPPPPQPGLPITGGLPYLFAVGIIYGIYNLKSKF